MAVLPSVTMLNLALYPLTTLFCSFAFSDKPLKTRAIVGLRTCFPKLSNALKDTYRKIRK